MGKLRNRQRRTDERILGTDEDLDAHAEPLERRKDRRRAAKRVVEGHVHLPEAGQSANLSQEEVRINAKAVLPGRRDGVVTENERPTGLH